jgi:hypothetical protein
MGKLIAPWNLSKRGIVSVISAACLILMSATAHAEPAPYRFTISASSSDPFVNTAAFSPGVQTYYLWLEGCNLPDPLEDGISAAELTLLSNDPSNLILAFNPINNWINNGIGAHLILVVGGCPSGPMIAGTILMLINAPGSLCFDGTMIGVDCSSNPQAWDLSSIGLDFGGGPCSELPLGACCLPSGLCIQDVDGSTCESFGGVFQGEETSCSNVNCSPVLGACCFADGSCEELGQIECQSAGGFFQGFGSNCDEAKCPPLGACCFPDASCVNDISESACESALGVFQGVGSTCANVNCNILPGACCLPDGSCVDGYDVAQCVSIGGMFQGLGTTCAGHPCGKLDSSPYGWGISGSASDPFVNTVPFVQGLQTSYLWLLCSPPGQGVSAAAFSLVSTNPANQFIAFNVMNGFLNAATGMELLLAVGGCPSGPIVAGSILMIMDGTGNLCINVTADGEQGTVDCLSTPALHPMDWIGLGIGTEPCVEDYPCKSPATLEPSSWGRIKAIYR